MSEHEGVSLPPQRTAEVPFAAYKRQQAAMARRRLYPLSAFYTLYAILVLAIAFSTKYPWIAVAFFSAGCVTWTLVEYLFHRYVLHGRFSPGKGLIRKFLHERLDPLHWDHHKHPFDGMHIICRSSRQLSISRLYRACRAGRRSTKLRLRRVAALRAALLQFQVPPLSADEKISPVPPQPARNRQRLRHHHAFLGRSVRDTIPRSCAPFPEQELK